MKRQVYGYRDEKFFELKILSLHDKNYAFVGLTFYEESCMNHFPINEYRTILHVRRRRWKDTEGKSVSKDWQLVADGTRYSKEFAAFLKEFVGYIPDYGQIAPETISHQGR